MMKRALSIFLALVLISPTFAEKKVCVVIHESQGQTAFDLQQKPVVSFQANDVRLVCGEVDVLYPLDDYLKMTIDEVDLGTSIDPSHQGSFSITGDMISARGCDVLTLYTTDGKNLLTTKANADGEATLSLEKLHKGVYLVKTNINTFKISKK